MAFSLPLDDERQRLWGVALVVAVGGVGALLATTTISIGLASLSADFGVPIDTAQWVMSGYLLGLAVAISVSGWVARRVGPRRLYLWSTAWFLAMGVVCVAAPSIEVLIASRVLQGVAGGAVLPVGQMMVATIAGPARMGRMMSIVGIPLTVTPFIGPVVGGVLVETVHWRAIFLLTVPLALTALVLGARLLPEVRTRAAGRFDWWGAALIGFGAPALIAGLAEYGRTGSLSYAAVLPILLGLGALLTFAVRALRISYPLLELRLWSNRAFAASVATALLVSANLFGTTVLLPLYYQLGRGEDAIATALLVLPQGIGAVISTFVAGRLTDRVGGGRVALVGMTLVLLATIPFVVAGPDTPAWLLSVDLVVRGVGLGAAIMPAFAAAYLTLHADDIPDATPQLNIFQRVGGAFGTAVLTAALASSIAAGAGPSTAAFETPFVLSMVIGAAALIPATVLARVERRPPAGEEVPGSSACRPPRRTRS